MSWHTLELSLLLELLTWGRWGSMSLARYLETERWADSSSLIRSGAEHIIATQKFLKNHWRTVSREDGAAGSGVGVAFPRSRSVQSLGPANICFAVSMLQGRKGSQTSIHQSNPITDFFLSHGQNPQILNGLWPALLDISNCWALLRTPLSFLKIFPSNICTAGNI